jgi:glycosyltransferase involved in cell wall biosynthesis
MPDKLISIIIPFYKTADYINETLLSVVQQTNFNLDLLEVIIVNDGDTFPLEPIVEHYKETIHNIALYNKPNGN